MILIAEAAPTPQIADDLCRHVHECLGGLARPANIAFLDNYPAGATPAVLHHALALVGAGRPKSDGFLVAAAPLREAIAATGSI